MTSFHVLGPVGATRAGVPVALGGARQRAVLARLLVARGRVVPVDMLVDDLWETPPAGAVAAIRTFVRDLRRALEPARAPRQPAALLVTTPPGYVLRAADVDAWQFEDLVARGTLPALDAALALWEGPPYAEFTTAAWARAAIDQLTELRALATERRAAALLESGRPAVAVLALREHVADRPLREDAWHLLVTALYRAGRQGEALAALRQARAVLADELGIAPGPRLQQLEADVFAQAPHLLAAGPPSTAVVGGSFVGRAAELAVLRDAADAVTSLAKPALVLVAGEAGAGKTALGQAVARRLGWRTVWARSPEHEGAPAEWPWQRGERLTDGREPVLVIADDLHRADGDSLDLLATVLEGAEPVLVLGTYRPADAGAELGRALARLARAEPVRVRLGGLSAAEIGELVRGQPVAPGLIHERSGGNPFFARELARLYASGAPAGEIPEGVRDVLRHRLTRLPGPVQEVLRRAAVLGREVDPEVLAGFAGIDVLDALDTALQAGFLTEAPLRFTHILVRDTVYDDLSALRRTRWHADAAAVLERLRPDDAVALAHHFGQAGDPRAAQHARIAADRAERRNNPHEAARLWRQAVATATGTDRLLAQMGLGRSLAVLGRLADTRALRAQAIEDAGRHGDPDVLARVLAGFDVPAIWPANDDPALSAQIVTAVQQALPGTEGDVRSRLLSTLALEVRGDTGTRGRDAAAEAERLARASDDPTLLALALNARFMHCFDRTGRSAERAAVGRELTAWAGRHGLVTFEVLGRLVELQSACAVGDFAAADTSAHAAETLAEEYDLPVVGVFTDLYRALRAGTVSYPALHRLAGAGMPGMADGLAGLVELSAGSMPAPGACGRYEPWARPVVLLAGGRRAEAAAALRSLPPSPHDLLWEARLVLAARVARAVGDDAVLAAVRAELAPAAGELAGAASGLLSFGPVADVLA
ncbi:BTAD domain-containing putative transcriptional regulator [Actinoplanes sp. N902-109]|uniref:BTAD domain-containing putative transcriptional regulator n=1 Tax=Actinoplanes sp. (strain N902-109) TaxID=649831 RepID=UPI001E2EEADE|nr:BTAD domain-containing putative transcriptional regulator [Actinoplanes sp. N902-109]